MGNNPLTEAIQQDNYLKVKEIIFSSQSELKLKKLLNSKRSEDGTPLHVAVYHRRHEIASFLLEKDSNVNSKSREVDINFGLFKIDQTFGYARCTPLHVAVWNKDIKMIELLLSKGADHRIENRKGKSPLDYAKKKKILKEVEELVEFYTKKRLESEEIGENKETEWGEFRKNLEFVKNANRGSFGVVQVMRLKIGYFESLVAVKKIVPKIETWNRDYKIFRNEVEHMKRLQHKNVAKLYGCYKNITELNIVMEYCKKGDLFHYKRNLNTLKQKIMCLIQIAEGMFYIHSKSVVHRDLKTKNVLIGDDGTMKITDFGLSIVGDIDSCSKMGASGTLGYAAPEQLNARKVIAKNPFLVDVYAFGVVIWEIFSLRTPYYDIPGENLRTLLKTSRVRPALKDVMGKMPKNLQIFMKKCWQTDPSDRPQSFGGVVEYLENFRKEMSEKL